jgi:hypothetical protein
MAPAGAPPPAWGELALVVVEELPAPVVEVGLLELQADRAIVRETKIPEKRRAAFITVSVSFYIFRDSVIISPHSATK